MRGDHGERLRRKELLALLPKDKDDLAAIDRLAGRSYPSLQPIIPDLLKWIRVES